MISTATILFCIVTLFVSLILPILILIIYGIKNKGQGIWAAWFLGAAGFFIPQMVIRLPVLNMLAATQGFQSFAQSHAFLYTLSLAFTAGLFELAGRFTVAKAMQKNLTYKRALAAGLGHGGIEAIVLIGATYINNLIYIAMIQSGSFDLIISQAAGMETVVAQLQLIRDSLVNTAPSLFLLAGLERLLTMVCHAAMSMIVCYAVYVKKTLPGVLLCLGIHTVIDLTTGISLLAGTVLSQTTAYILIYAVLAAVAVASVLILKNIRSRWQDAAENGGAL